MLTMKFLPGFRSWLALPAVLAVLLLAACSDNEQSDRALPARPALETVTLEAVATAREQVWDGVVEAIEHTTLAAQTSARVDAMLVDVGDRVKKGDVLMRLTDIEQRSGQRSAQAGVEAARAEHSDAAAEFERTEKMYERGLTSSASLDAASARFNAAVAMLAAAEAALESAGQQAEYTTVTAPFDGVITERFVEPGQAVQSGPPAPQPLLAMLAPDALRVEVTGPQGAAGGRGPAGQSGPPAPPALLAMLAPDALRGEVTVPQSAAGAIRRSGRAVVFDRDGRRIEAAALTVFPRGDAQTHSFRVRVALPERVEDLYPGMTVKVGFEMKQDRRLMVPESAVMRRGELSGVYVMNDDGTLLLRQIRRGHASGGEMEVLAGLKEHDRVVLDPVAAAAHLAAHHQSDTKRR